MQTIVPIALRAVFTFVAFVAIQYIIPYFFLAIGGLLAGLYLWRTGEDRQLGIGMLIGTAIFTVFAKLYGNV